MKTIVITTAFILAFLAGGITGYLLFKKPKPEIKIETRFLNDSLKVKKYQDKIKIKENEFDSLNILYEELKIKRSKVHYDTVRVKELIENKKTDTACRNALISQINHIEALEASVVNLEEIKNTQSKEIELRAFQAIVYDSLLLSRNNEVKYLYAKTNKLRKHRDMAIGAAMLVIIITIIK